MSFPVARKTVSERVRNAGPGLRGRRVMSSLPDRPDLAQLRRQARELQRAAGGGDPGAVRRIRQVSAQITLSVAQLALAREYGFASWAKLKDEAERRRASAPDPAPP